MVKDHRKRLVREGRWDELKSWMKNMFYRLHGVYGEVLGRTVDRKDVRSSLMPTAFPFDTLVPAIRFHLSRTRTWIQLPDSSLIVPCSVSNSVRKHCTKLGLRSYSLYFSLIAGNLRNDIDVIGGRESQNFGVLSVRGPHPVKAWSTLTSVDSQAIPNCHEPDRAGLESHPERYCRSDPAADFAIAEGARRMFHWQGRGLVRIGY